MLYTSFLDASTSFCLSNGTPASSNCFLALACASLIFCASVFPGASFVPTDWVAGFAGAAPSAFVKLGASTPTDSARATTEPNTSFLLFFIFYSLILFLYLHCILLLC